MDISKKLKEDICIFIFPEKEQDFNNFTDDDISQLKSYPVLILPDNLRGSCHGIVEKELLQSDNIVYTQIVHQISSQTILSPDSFDSFYLKYKELFRCDKNKPEFVTFFNFDNVTQIRTSIISLRESAGYVPFVIFQKFNSSGISNDGFSIYSYMEMVSGFENGCAGFVIDNVNCSIIDKIQGHNFERKLPIALFFSEESEQNIEKILDNLGQLNVRVIGLCSRKGLYFLKRLNFKTLKKRVDSETTLVHSISGLRDAVYFGNSFPFVKIGERINPTNRKSLSEAIKSSNLIPLVEEARRQIENESHCLDVNLGVPGINQREIFVKAIVEIQNNFDVPIFIDSDRKAVIEDCLKVYRGKPTINSINAKEESYEELLPIAKKYGSIIVLLTVDNKLPETTSDRIRILEKMLSICQEYNVAFDKIIVDPVVFAAGTAQDSAKGTLEAIKIIKKEFGLPTIVGLSNVSFGLPERKYINRAFLICAIMMGLDGAIFNPLDKEMHNYIASASGLSGRDKNFTEYIKRFRKIDIDFDIDLDL